MSVSELEQDEVMYIENDSTVESQQEPEYVDYCQDDNEFEEAKDSDIGISVSAKLTSAHGADDPHTQQKAETKSTLSSNIKIKSSISSSSHSSRSVDGITTLHRRALLTTKGKDGIERLLRNRHPELVDKLLLSRVKNHPKLIQRTLDMKSSGGLSKRVNSLAEPKSYTPRRQFANDDDERAYRIKKRKQKQRGSQKNTILGSDEECDTHELNDVNAFVSRMEVAEKAKQKRLEDLRGEKEYAAKTKKECPKCDAVQTYAEFRDKKKKCQNCNVNFRYPNTWGDISSNFFMKINTAARETAERKEQLLRQVIEMERRKDFIAPRKKPNVRIKEQYISSTSDLLWEKHNNMLIKNSATVILQRELAAQRKRQLQQ